MAKKKKSIDELAALNKRAEKRRSSKSALQAPASGIKGRSLPQAEEPVEAPVQVEEQEDG